MAFRSDDRICYEFDDFFVDPIRRVLLRGDEPLQVSPKALSILVVLLAQAGEAVDKVDLIEKVWGGAQVSEANLTQNVFALRKILGEKANESRYVVTVPGRGYCFKGEVRRIDRSASGVFPMVASAAAPPEKQPEILLETPSAVAEPLALPAEGSSESPLEARAPRRSHVKRWVALLALGLLGAALLGFLNVHFRRGSTLPAATAVKVRPSIVVLKFRSLSPKSETDWLRSALPEMLTTDLAAGGKLRVLRGETVAMAQRSLSYQKSGNLSRDDLAMLQTQLGADLVVLGSYLPIGDELRLDLRVVRAPQ
ncbi:MAG TPA: winged helix-turn-helix domain-containing protein, partial [Thermoanaerobaculia bacterium]